MESFLSSGDPADICAVFAHNDDMAIGAIEAIKEAGLDPGTDIKIVSVDAIPDIFDFAGCRRHQCHGRTEPLHGWPGV